MFQLFSWNNFTWHSFYAQPEHINCNSFFGGKEFLGDFFLSLFKSTTAHLYNGLLPQQALHQVILGNHMEMSLLLLLSAIPDTAHPRSWTSETLLICFLV